MKELERRDFMKLGLGAVTALGAGAGSPADAQTAAAQGGAARVRSVDMHSHWSPEVYNKAFAAKTGKPPDEQNNALYWDRQKRTAWMDQNKPNDEELRRFRTESSALLGSGEKN